MLFHRDVFMPTELKFKLNFKNEPLTYSRHAIMAAQTDRYMLNGIKLKSYISFSFKDVVEAEIINNKIAKLVVRLSYDLNYDITYVLLPGGKVKTVWLNKKTDQHKTLNVNNYIKKGA